MNNEQRTTNYERRTKRAFTLIELVVAVGILAMVLSFAGVIFKVSINAHRASSANAEIMRKLRAITGQLNADFKGLRKDAPLLIWFRQDANDPDQRYDQILVFADGDFQSTQLYDSGSNAEPDNKTGEKLVRGNVARIQYAQAQIPDPNGSGSKEPFDLDEEDRILARRRHILTTDPCLAEWPDPNRVEETFDDPSVGTYKNNELYEHDSLSLARWKTVDRDNYDEIIDVCFIFRPWIDMDDPNTFHKLMFSGIGSFAIQWAYWDEDNEKFYWFPGDDPAGDGSVTSHFELMDSLRNERFGVYFNVPNSSQFEDWYPINDAAFSGKDFSSYPKALKFTFKLYDSKGVIENGREFTHIVYLGD